MVRLLQTPKIGDKSENLKSQDISGMQLFLPLVTGQAPSFWASGTAPHSCSPSKSNPALLIHIQNADLKSILLTHHADYTAPLYASLSSLPSLKASNKLFIYFHSP